MRRHPPRVSPSCTRVFGPIDAMTREPRSAPARTVTQFRATELTHAARAARDFGGAFASTLPDAFAGVFAGAFATALVDAFGVAGGVGVRAFAFEERAGERAIVRGAGFDVARGFDDSTVGAVTRVVAATGRRSATAAGPGPATTSFSDTTRVSRGGEARVTRGSR